ncbi:Gfo/Idh/MocA family oxidoreductase [Salipaludibacillus sp. LMS25]|jgi:predicted dehydrogenase|uniref:Gfo/Idh/MocA family protein n=1 Tax=Salipaludibacillus sp. LMS25 TaxID=2924031 RepID=UPI0020D16688|nr:Gfo/Idh/MocA family oxidoreductase [Salipaludibacillus sp. LMS25]UTR16379.1 Gfo/Idh/MocA family oxidoreductase [Salipaludibacillus sp. LMS25]
MIRYGVIGTNFITDWFVEAGQTTKDFKLTAVYSRTEERAKEFAQKHGAEHTFTQLEDMAASHEIDAVYIASPTALHAEQAILCMQHGKHVLCEKPIASHDQEVTDMIKTAEKQGIVLMEAVKNTALPNFKHLRHAIEKIAPIRRIVTNFCQYSSRYDAYKEGTVLNAFKPELSNGSLMDIGLYCLYPIVDLFGEPENVQATGVLLESGVDGEGTVVLSYPEMEGIAMYSKITNSRLPSEIQGENGSIVIDHIQTLSDMRVYYRDGSEEVLGESQTKPVMSYEIDAFHQKIKGESTDEMVNTLSTSLTTSHVMTEARDQLGVRFPADRSRK